MIWRCLRFSALWIGRQYVFRVAVCWRKLSSRAMGGGFATGFKQTEALELGRCFFGNGTGVLPVWSGKIFPEKMWFSAGCIEIGVLADKLCLEEEHDSAGLNRQSFDESYPFVGLKTKALSRWCRAFAGWKQSFSLMKAKALFSEIRGSYSARAETLFFEIREVVLWNQKCYSAKTELLFGVNRASVRTQ